MIVKAATTDELSSDGEVRLKAGEIVLINGRRLVAGNLIGGVQTLTDANDPHMSQPFSDQTYLTRGHL
jgi:hypothetical protein